MKTSAAAIRTFAKVVPLLLVTGMDIGVPFLRMLALSHFLDLRELGFASLLAATCATYEQVTDISIYRFVLAAPRAVFAEALGAAHALSLARGILVGSFALAVSWPVAAAFSLAADWQSFATLGIIVFARSLEHLAPRIAERDYRYAIQLKVALISNSLSLSALAISLFVAPTHVAILASLFGQAVGQVVASHLFSSEPYRLRFGSPQFLEGFKFGYPLIVSGCGQAISSQGDRFIVGAMLGLPALGVYSVLLLAAVVPITMVIRVLGTVTVAMLVNAAHAARALTARLKLASRVAPLVAGLYAIGIATLINIVVPKLFGQKFLASREMVVILAFGVFVRIVRYEPGMSVLLFQGRTKRLALASVVNASTLAFSFLFLYFWKATEAAVLGRLAGDFLAMVSMMYLSRRAMGAAFRDSIHSVVLAAAIVGAVCGMVAGTSVGSSPGPTLAVLVGCGLAGGFWLLSFLPGLLQMGSVRQGPAAH